MLIRSCIAAALTLTAVPSFAGGYEVRTPYQTAPVPQYEDHDSRLVVDHSGRVVFDDQDDHCAPRQQVVVEDEYTVRRTVRPAANYSRYGY